MQLRDYWSIVRRRLWLVLLIYLVGTTALMAGLMALGVSGVVQLAVGFLIAVLIGCEAGSLRTESKPGA